MERQIIYGVCDKLYDCDSYYGFFKNKEDASKELKVQAQRIKDELGITDIITKEDRAVVMENERIEKIILILHAYVVR